MIEDRITKIVRKLWKDVVMVWKDAKGASRGFATIWNTNIIEVQKMQTIISIRNIIHT